MKRRLTPEEQVLWDHVTAGIAPRRRRSQRRQQGGTHKPFCFSQLERGCGAFNLRCACGKVCRIIAIPDILQ